MKKQKNYIKTIIKMKKLKIKKIIFMVQYNIKN